METVTILQRVKVPGTLALIAGMVALLAHGAVTAPRFFSRPPGNHQELRRSPSEPVQSPDTTRSKRSVRPRPVSA